jgi:hypothetical protein
MLLYFGRQTTAPYAAASQLGSTLSLGTLSANAMSNLQPSNTNKNAMPNARGPMFSQKLQFRAAALI